MSDRQFNIRVTESGAQQVDDRFRNLGRTIDSVGDRTNTAFDQWIAKSRKIQSEEEREEELWRKKIGIIERATREYAKYNEQSEKRAISALKSTSVLAGVHDARALDSLIGGMGGPAAIGGLAVTAGLGVVTNIVRSATEGARALQNLADEFGLTANEAFKLKSAAEVTGVGFGMMTSAARKLAQAIEEPGGAGKKTAEELTKMGISLRQGMGGALEEVIHKLAGINDAAERIKFGTALGREFTKIAAVAPELDKVKGELGDLNEATQKNLLEADKSIEKFKNSWTLLEGHIASSVISIVSAISQLGHARNPYSDLYASLGGDPSRKPAVAGGSKEIPGDPTRLLRLLNQDNSSKLGIDEQLSAKKLELSNAEAMAQNDAASKKSQKLLDEDYEKVKKLKDEYLALEAAKKKAGASGGVDRLGDALSSLSDEVDSGTSPSSLVNVMRNRLRFHSKFGSNQRADDLFNVLQHRALQGHFDQAAGGLTREADENQKEVERIIRERSNTSLHESTSASDEASKEFIRTGIQLKRMSNDNDADYARRKFSRGARMSELGGGGPNEAYAAQLHLAKELYDINLKNANLEEDEGRRQIEQARAKYEYIRDQDEARIEREQKIAELGKQQREETRGFVQGLFGAATSHEPGAVQNYLSGFGKNMLSNVVGNAAEAFLPTLNKAFGLPHSMLMDKSGNRSALGKLLKGTPLDASAEDIKNAPLIESQSKLIDAIDANTSAIGGKPTSGGTMSPSNTLIGSIGKLVGGPGGTSGFAGPIDIMHRMFMGPSRDAGPRTGMGGGISGDPYYVSPDDLAQLNGGDWGPDADEGNMPSGGGVGSGGSSVGGLRGFFGKYGGSLLGAAGGAFQAVQGFRSGGGRGIASGIGGSLTAASMIDPEPISKAVLGIGALISDGIASLFGDPRQNRERAIEKNLTYNKYIEPNQHEYSYSTSGGGVSYGANGLQGGGAHPANYTVNIQAMDSHSFYQFLASNPKAFGNGMAMAVGQSGVETLSTELAYHHAHP